MNHLKTIVFLAFAIAVFSCKHATQQQQHSQTILSVADTPGISAVDDSALMAEYLEIASELPYAPTILTTGVKDTTIIFNIEDISAEGSEAKVRYVNDSIKTVEWSIYGETGQGLIKYVFPKDGYIYAEEKIYRYKRGLNDTESEKDMILEKTLKYTMRIDGLIIKPPKDKEFESLYPEFRANVPLILTFDKKRAKNDVALIEKYFKNIPKNPEDEKPIVPLPMIGQWFTEEVGSEHYSVAEIRAVQHIKTAANEQFFLVSIDCGAGGFCTSFYLLVFDTNGKFVRKQAVGYEAGDLGFSQYFKYKVIGDTLRTYKISYDHDEGGAPKEPADTTIKNIILKVSAKVEEEDDEEN